MNNQPYPIRSSGHYVLFFWPMHPGNCMEKLLEVLIAIGDEVACLSVSQLILRHWPSHSRALHVKNTILESEPIPFSPRDSSYEDDLVQRKNTSRGDYQTKEQCADVFQYILPYAKRTGLVKLRRVLRTIRKHIPQPPDNVLAGNAIDKFLDDPNLCEDKLSEVAGSDGFLDSIMKIIFPDGRSLKQLKASSLGSSDPYLEVYCNLYYLLAQYEEMSATDKWAGFVLTKEGEEFVEQNANLFKYDLQVRYIDYWHWNVVPFYDQRSVLPLKDSAWMMFFHNAMRDFKKAFVHKEDWSHAFYLGKLSEKLGYSHETSFSYYDKAIDLNPSAVDAVYRMHASCLKLLCTCGKQNREALKWLMKDI
ncbi:Calcineurin-binding protein 1 [Camellia lanceoleosa]|uniref:Calcineurin-binding protein 1 n=1 Tax=Camellia lanceoleosa TaxID=1840588 RepID=A0ACC0FI44_9ERIC|nr:Calcineurin-binding protein 1 [Camellia lanceoleosa]